MNRESHTTLFIKIDGLLAMKFINFCRQRKMDHDKTIEEAVVMLMVEYELREKQARDAGQ